jgi:hypothetical protein
LWAEAAEFEMCSALNIEIGYCREIVPEFEMGEAAEKEEKDGARVRDIVWARSEYGVWECGDRECDVVVEYGALLE